MGRLSAEDYRRQRDELLAAANAGQSPAGQDPGAGPTNQGPSGPAPTGTPPGGIPGQPSQQQQAPGQTPFPPAFKWAAQPPGTQSAQPGNAERTQAIRPVGQDNQSANPDATQIVHNNPGMDRTQAVRPSDADRTQVVHGAQYTQPQAGQPSQQQWPGGDQASLYSSGGMDNMPNWNTGGAFGDWPKQGPEVFETKGGNNNKTGRRVALIALIVVVLAGLGVGGWLLFGNKGSAKEANPPTTQTHTAAPTTTPGPRKMIGPLVYAPGNPDAQTFTPTQLTTLKPLSKPDLDILASTTLKQADYVVSRDGTTVIDLWAFTVSDESDAAVLAKKFDTDQGRFGFESTDIKTSDGQYTAYTSQQQSADQNVVVYRLHYVVGNQVIRVEAFDPDPTKAREEFVKLLNLQTQLTPPSNS